MHADKKINAMKPITPFLWFDNQAVEAANFYISIFPNSRILSPQFYGEDTPGEAGTVMTVQFELNGQEFTALNGGPHFSFTPAISFVITCADQAEVDYFWDRLLEGGQPEQCGWLKDKFGVSWQVVPEILGRLMNDADPQKAHRVTQAMLKMVKLDIPGLEQAYSRDH